MRAVSPTLLDLVVRDAPPDAVALVGRDRAYRYADLADAVAERAAGLELPDRSVVVLSGSNSIDWVISYLALLSARHVPLLAGGRVDRLVDHWSPAGVLTADGDGWSFERIDAARPEVHPDLAILMSTSGSTGSPKLVRLSSANLVANAASIAEFQQLTADDRGITNLPLHYSLGLSVLHSHLAVGASVVVTDNSVVDACFARALAEHGVTNIAGVPHTYELLDQAGPERLRVPSLRFLAQAGGRMEPDRVARWAARARSWGVEWYSMYGQTEATARISYVPPAMVHDHPGTIGIAIPGGELTAEPIDDDVAVAGEGAVGELVYRGPNVMAGYAVEPADLALGAQLTELRTGDLGRVDPATGLYEIVGRRSRRIKPFGLRIDLDDVEQRLDAAGFPVKVAGDDDLVVAAAGSGDAAALLAHLIECTGLPEARLRVVGGEPPRTTTGKVDYASLLAAGRSPTPAAAADDTTDDHTDDHSDDGDLETHLRSTYAAVLGRSGVAASDSFVGVGGDSLSYVECSIRVEQILGRLPRDWHLLPIADLAAAAGRRRLARVDTTVVLRAIGILAVVSTHMHLWHWPGGAHLMLAVVGYNLARFMLPIADTRERVRAGMRTVGRVAVPTVLWTLAFMAVGTYTWTTLTLVNNYIGPRSHDGNHWHFWFIEVFVHIVVLTTVVTAIPAVRRIDTRWPYLFPLGLLGLLLTMRMDWAEMGDWYNLRYRTHSIAWFFVLGWLVYRSRTRPQRIATTVLCFAVVPGFFHNPTREYFIAAALVVLVWVKEIPMPRLAVRPVATIAAASMWIYLSHFVIWPPMKDWFIVEVAYPLTVLASLGVWWVFTQSPRLLRPRFPRLGRTSIQPLSNRAPTAPTPV